VGTRRTVTVSAECEIGGLAGLIARHRRRVSIWLISWFF